MFCTSTFYFRDHEAAMHLSYPSIKSTLNRKRAEYKPPVPNSFASLCLELEKYNACKDIYKGSIIAEDGSMGLLFSSNELLSALNESAELFVDGTFSVICIITFYKQVNFMLL